MIRLVILLIFSTYLTAGELYSLDNRFQPIYGFNTQLDNYNDLDTLDKMEMDTIVFINYPAKPLLYSLILPGLGQYKNGDPIWKPALFASIELASIAGWVQWNKQAEDIRKQYEQFGDIHWTLKGWVENTLLIPVISVSEYPDFRIDGTHKLSLHLSGILADNFGEFVSSDSLVDHPEWIYSDNISLSKDQHFYENIGKYDQFVGGWDDIDQWYSEEKTVEDTVEIILKTPNKNDYLNDRAHSNQFLKLANYAVTAVMFNHLISGLEAVLTNQRQARDKVKQSKTDVGLYYDPKTKYGIGGISVSYNW